MSGRFDRELFYSHAAHIIVQSRGKTFDELSKEIEHLRTDVHAPNASARRLVDRHLGYLLFSFAIDTDEPPEVSERLYRKARRTGFNDLHNQVYAAIQYAYFAIQCNKRDDGLRELSSVSKVVSRKRSLSEEVRKNFLDAIDLPMRRLKAMP